MRAVKSAIIQDAVKELFLKANYVIEEDIYNEIQKRRGIEKSAIGRSVLEQIIRNYDIAKKEQVAICQDTGLAIIFVEIGQEVIIVGGDFNDAINQGVRNAYIDGYLRKSVVSDPLFIRKNTNDNTPAIIHVSIVPGDSIKLIVTAKGFGSENMSSLRMFKPSDGIEGVKKSIIEDVIKAGPNPCPPVIVGVGIGGTMEVAALLAKKATLRPIGQKHPEIEYAKLEKEILDEINKSGIGPAGLGGLTTAIAVNIDYFPTHIAGLPVAVNICCHASRHAEMRI